MLRTRLTSILLCIGLELSGLSCRARSIIPPPARPDSHAASFVRKLGPVSEYVLSNGLQVLLIPDQARSTTIINITYHVGSRQEKSDGYGAAHLLEHLIFRGSVGHPDIQQEFASKGIDFNAATTVDRTSYYGSFAPKERTLPWLINVMADSMKNSRLSPDDIELEKNIVKNELERRDDNPVLALAEGTQSFAFTKHPYGRPIGGSIPEVLSLTRTVLLKFYRTFYRPNNATLIIAGRFDEVSALNSVRSAFGSMSNPPDQPYHIPQAEPPQQGERSAFIRKSFGIPAAEISYHIPAIWDKDFAALRLYGALQTSDHGSLSPDRIFKMGLVRLDFGAVASFDPGLAQLNATFKDGVDIETASRAIEGAFEDDACQNIADASVEKTRERLRNSYRSQIRAIASVPGQLLDDIGAGDWRLTFNLYDELAEVTPKSVSEACRKYLTRQNRTATYYLPALGARAIEMPASRSAAERLNSLQFEEDAGNSPIPSTDIDSLAHHSSFESVNPGFSLQILDRPTEDDFVAASIHLRWPDALDHRGVKGGSFVGRLLLEGSLSIDKATLATRLQDLNATLIGDSDDYGLTLDVTAKKETFKEVLSIVGDLLKHPAISQSAFDRLLRAKVSSSTAYGKSANNLAREASRQYLNSSMHLGTGSTNYIEGHEEQLARLRSTSLDEVKSAFQQLTDSATGGIAIAGNLPEGLTDFVKNEFHSFGPSKAASRPIQPYILIPPKRFDVNLDGAKNATLRMDQEVRMNGTDDDCILLSLASIVFGGDNNAASVLNQHVRNESGLAYFINAQTECMAGEERAAINISSSFSSENRELILAKIDEALNNFSASGPTSAQLDIAKASLIDAARLDRTQDLTLADTMSSLASQHQNWSFVLAREAKILAARPEAVKAAWGRAVHPFGFVVTTVGDFNAHPAVLPSEHPRSQ